MSYNTVRQALETKFRAEWTHTSTTPDFIRYSNAVFDPPIDQKWSSIDVHWLPNTNVAIAVGAVVRRNGILVIDVYDKLDSGTGDLLDMAEAAVNIFENKQVVVTGDTGSVITLYAATVKHIGVANRQGADPVWYQYAVRIPFFRDE